jgi:ubiquinone/menaquinone biosynthesis C-methylase UbiE
VSPHPDPYRELDVQADPAKLLESLEVRARTPSHARVRRRFLRFLPIRRGDQVLEVGCGTGPVLRDLVALVGPRGRVVGVDNSRNAVRAARILCEGHGRPPRLTIRHGEGARLPFAGGRFDATVAITVVLHVADPLALTREMARVTRPGGRIGLQDQDFGAVVVSHPDRVLTERILRGVVDRMYEEPFSGRRLPALLRETGLTDVRVRTDVYEDARLVPWTKNFLERRAEVAVRFGIVSPAEAQGWLDGFTGLVAAGAFVFTMNYYGAVGVKPARSR